MKSYIFQVVIEEDKFEDGRKAFSAYCPALQGCRTWGHTYKEALANIKEAVELYVDDLRESGKPIPIDPEKGTEERSTPSVAINL
jgi:predicted RNase H-like HicB family nuclease